MLSLTRGASASGWRAQRQWGRGTTNTGAIETETTGAASALSVIGTITGVSQALRILHHD